MLTLNFSPVFTHFVLYSVLFGEELRSTLVYFGGFSQGGQIWG